jgi:ribosomal protein L13E
MLAKARFALLALVAVDEGRGFCVEAMQTIGLLVHKGVILGNKLPSDFRRHDVLVDGGRGGRRRHLDAISSSRQQIQRTYGKIKWK